MTTASSAVPAPMTNGRTDGSAERSASSQRPARAANHTIPATPISPSCSQKASSRLLGSSRWATSAASPLVSRLARAPTPAPVTGCSRISEAASCHSCARESTPATGPPPVRISSATDPRAGAASSAAMLSAATAGTTTPTSRRRRPWVAARARAKTTAPTASQAAWLRVSAAAGRAITRNSPGTMRSIRRSGPGTSSSAPASAISGVSSSPADAARGYQAIGGVPRMSGCPTAAAWAKDPSTISATAAPPTSSARTNRPISRGPRSTEQATPKKSAGSRNDMRISSRAACRSGLTNTATGNDATTSSIGPVNAPGHRGRTPEA